MEEFKSCLEKQENILKLFKDCTTPDKLYTKIIELGKNQPNLSKSAKIPENKVSGCQSQVFLEVSFKEGLIFFNAEADAMISAGLAYLVTKVYSAEPPEALLKCPPTYLKKLGLDQALTPGRSNGLNAIFIRMQQEALKILVSCS